MLRYPGDSRADAEVEDHGAIDRWLGLKRLIGRGHLLGTDRQSEREDRGAGEKYREC